MTQTITRDTPMGLADVKRLARQLRVDSIRAAEAPASGHVTSSLSAADIGAVLLARHLRYDWDAPDNPDNDHLIFSKGHASPLLYSMFKAAGVIDDEELVSSYRAFGSRLQGHPTPELPWVDVATGSLGQGLPIGAGLAWAAQRLDRRDYHVWVLCGDSEMAEGSMWEALATAGEHKLSALTAIVDVNRLGQSGPTALQWDLDAYARRVRGFDVDAVVVDGHDVEELDAAMRAARSSQTPTVILAKTIKGKGVVEVEDKEGWHGKPLPPDLARRAVAALGGTSAIRCRGPKPELEAWHPDRPAEPTVESREIELPQYELGDQVAPRTAYGDALAAIGVDASIVALDAEVGNSTHSEEFAKRYPGRYFQAYTAEQQLVATAVALSVRGRRPFASTFAVFFSRAYDFIRMAAISQANIRLCGSHAGVEIGEDGPSQMALEDIAAMRAILGSTVLYPSDATSTAALTREMAHRDGISYLRTTRGKYPVLYPADEAFPIGGSKVLRSSGHDAVTLIGAGVTVHTCLAAADALRERDIQARVIDLYSIKPIDREGLARAARETGSLVVVEDHHPEGGIASAVLEALAELPDRPVVVSLAVDSLPGSGTGAQLMDAMGIGVDDVVVAAEGVAR